jgi:(E)-4-hydroxy-3-methylbut-2-enyl-diphosphate synthase
LGVTEAGEGEDGRIKSAVGIGTLLEDGLGDTVRVSLTEEPEFEIPVAKALVDRYSKRINNPAIPPVPLQGLQTDLPYSPYSFSRRQSATVLNIGAEDVPRVVADFSTKKDISPASLFAAGYSYSIPLDKWSISDQACDFVYVGSLDLSFEIPGTLSVLYDAAHPAAGIDKRPRCYPLYAGSAYQSLKSPVQGCHFIFADEDFLHSLEQLSSEAVLVLHTANPNGMAALRRMCIELEEKKIRNPVFLKRTYAGIKSSEVQLFAATDTGGLFADGFGDGIWLQADLMPLKELNALSFGILQATRLRISKTEYISCPSCGRTLFDLQETTARIRSRTSHLKGIKIGIMGCIVNGPGEMADADYGYVGTGIGKITLYKGKEVVERNIDSEKAVDALIDLIRRHGDWVEHPTEAVS